MKNDTYLVCNCYFDVDIDVDVIVDVDVNPEVGFSHCIEAENWPKMRLCEDLSFHLRC